MDNGLHFSTLTYASDRPRFFQGLGVKTFTLAIYSNINSESGCFVSQAQIMRSSLAGGML